jgi:hypothetical protein
VADAAVDDASGRVYLFTRRPSMVLVHTLDGEFLSVWGRDTFTRPHGITVLPDGPVLCVDDGACVVRRFTGDGPPSTSPPSANGSGRSLLKHALVLTFNLESPILLFVGMIRSYV